MSLLKIVHWLVIALALATYLAMLFWTIPQLEALSGGETIFDMRPTGYSVEQGMNLLARLGDEGRSFYENRQQFLDLFYPVLLAIALVGGFCRLAPSPWSHVLSAAALAGMIFDYLENFKVKELLIAGTEADPAGIETASMYTVLKSAFDAIAMSAMLVFLTVALWRRLSSRRPA